MKSLFVSLAVLWMTPGCGPSNDGAKTGVSGSSARFAIQRDYLVVISDNALKVFDLRTPNDPMTVYEAAVPSRDVQAIFAYLDHYLLLGADDGMYIYEIEDTGRTIVLGLISHARACDQVVATDSVAYITLNDLDQCGQVAPNELRIVDVTDLNSPSLIAIEPLAGPKGLALSGTELFVCDKMALARFDVTDPSKPELLILDGTIRCEDIIVVDDLLYATGEKVSIYLIEPVSENSSGLKRLSTLPSSSSPTKGATLNRNFNEKDYQ